MSGLVSCSSPEIQWKDVARLAIQKMVEDATVSITPRYFHQRVMKLLKSGRSAVSEHQKRASAGDFICRAPFAVFRLFQLEASQAQDGQSRSIRRNTSTAGSISVHTRSSILGAPVVRSYASASDVATAIVAAMPSESMGDLLSDVRILPGQDSLIFTTHRHMMIQRKRGMLACPLCGVFYKGERGIRDHTLIKHKRSYEQSKAAAAESRTAIVPYWRRGDEVDAEWVASIQEEAKELDQRSNMLRGRTLMPGLIAARDGDIAEVQRLVREEGWDPNPSSNKMTGDAAAIDRHGSCALMWAAGGGHLELCRWLVSNAGLDPHAAQTHHRSRRTPLHWAARNGHMEVCKWLVDECGVDPDVRSMDGTSAFHYAVHSGHANILYWLVGWSHGSDAGGSENFKPPRAHLAHSVNAFGCNAVQWAALSGSVEMCKLLLYDFKLDFTLLNHNMHSVFHKAAVKGNIGVCTWLLEDSHIPGEVLALLLGPDKSGNTPSELARLEGFDKLSAYLSLAESGGGESGTTATDVEDAGNAGESFSAAMLIDPSMNG